MRILRSDDGIWRLTALGEFAYEARSLEAFPYGARPEHREAEDS